MSYALHIGMNLHPFTGKGDVLTRLKYSRMGCKTFNYKNQSFLIFSYYVTAVIQLTQNRGGGAVGESVRLASGRLGVRIPAATDLSRKNR